MLRCSYGMKNIINLNCISINMKFVKKKNGIIINFY